MTLHTDFYRLCSVNQWVGCLTTRIGVLKMRVPRPTQPVEMNNWDPVLEAVEAYFLPHSFPYAQPALPTPRLFQIWYEKKPLLFL